MNTTTQTNATAWTAQSDVSQWVHILSPSEIEAHHALTASIDPSFARGAREFYQARSANELRALAAQAWNCCCPTSYQLARSYLAMIG